MLFLLMSSAVTSRKLFAYMLNLFVFATKRFFGKQHRDSLRGIFALKQTVNLNNYKISMFFFDIIIKYIIEELFASIKSRDCCLNNNFL